MSVSRLAVVCLLLLGGCATTPSRSTDTTFKVEIGSIDTYSSTTGVYTRHMCRGDDVQTQIVLAPSELQEIGQLAEDTGFFSLPTSIPQVPDKNGKIWVSSGCQSYALEIHQAGEHHRVSWDCDTTQDGREPAQLREVYSTIINALEPARSKLPESQCRFY
jgi:hypothetical protein